MAILNDIDPLAAEHATALSTLAGVRDAYVEEERTLRRKHGARLRKLAEHLKGTQAALAAAIAANPQLFERPRTVILHGLKLGLQKEKGKLAWDDEDAVIARIRKLLPEEQAELLIRVEESVAKAAVYDLAAADLKRLGIRIEADSDKVVIKSALTDLDKWLDMVLKDEPMEVEA